MSADSRMETYKIWLSIAGGIWLEKYYSAAVSYHNSILEIAASLDLVLFLIIILILTFFKSIAKLFNNRYFKNKRELFILFIISFFFQSMTGLSLEINPCFMVSFWICINVQELITMFDNSTKKIEKKSV